LIGARDPEDPMSYKITDRPVSWLCQVGIEFGPPIETSKTFE